MKVSHLLIGLAAASAILGLAGFVLHSFSYPLALLLAALFAFAGLLSSLTRSSRRPWVLFGITTGRRITGYIRLGRGRWDRRASCSTGHALDASGRASWLV